MLLKLKKIKYLFFLIIFFLSCIRSGDYEEIEKRFQPISSEYGIKIVYMINQDYAPILIGGSRAQFSKVKKIDPAVLALYPAILLEAFAKYPVQVIKMHLKAIYFAKEIDQSGFKLAGTYDQFRQVLYLTNDGRQSDELSIATFHHEFSSLLLSKHGFFLNPWFAQNPEGFKYRRELYADWKKEYQWASIKEIIPDYGKGFLSLYGQTNFENDFNEYSEMIFTYPKKFKKIMKRYPRVRGKFLVWLEFYHQIDPVFTEEYLLGAD